jgi:hypothetical protein
VSTQNKITLTIAGDSTSVERALKRTEAAAAHAGTVTARSSKDVANGLHDVRNSANATAASVDGAMYAVRALGGEISPVVQGAYSLSLGFSQMAHGLGTLVPKLKESASSLGVLRLGIVGAAAALGTWAISTEGALSKGSTYTTALKDMNYAVAHNINLVGKHIPLLGHLTGAYEKNANAASLAAHATYDLDAALDKLNNQKRIAGTFGIADQNPGGDAAFDQSTLDMMELDPAVLAKQYAGASASVGSGSAHVAKAVSSGIDKIAQAAKDKLARWQGIADQFSQVAKGIADSLGPKLVAGVASPLMLAKGTTLLDNLKQQLKDTLHLQKDLKALSKAGLKRSLLEQLTAGGLDSLGVADELLGSGKSGIRDVNRTATAINNAAGSIAGQDAARQLADSLKKPQVVELRVGKGGDDILDRWLSKTLKTKGPKYFGLKAA